MYQKIFTGALSGLLAHRVLFAKTLALPFLFNAVLQIVVAPQLTGWALVPVSILSWMLSTLIAVTIHRVLLQGPDTVSIGSVWHWRKPETVFLFYLIAVGVITSVVFIPFAFMGAIPYVGIILPFVGIFASFYMVGRFSLVFPSAAIGRRMTLNDSFVATKDYGMVMFAVVILLPTLLAIALVFLEKIPGGEVISYLLDVIVILFTVSLLSMAYRHIVEENPTAR